MTDRRTILVADDSDTLRSLLESILSREGYRVVEAEDGQGALRAFSEEDVDAVLLDVRLGVDDGVELGRKLRLERPDVPIALMSGSMGAREAREQGADLTDHFLSKPFTLEDVAAIIDALLGRPR